jgi:hypothetical protein
MASWRSCSELGFEPKSWETAVPLLMRSPPDNQMQMNQGMSFTSLETRGVDDNPIDQAQQAIFRLAPRWQTEDHKQDARVS